jgi:hypothetical protein
MSQSNGVVRQSNMWSHGIIILLSISDYITDQEGVLEYSYPICLSICILYLLICDCAHSLLYVLRNMDIIHICITCSLIPKHSHINLDTQILWGQSHENVITMATTLVYIFFTQYFTLCQIQTLLHSISYINNTKSISSSPTGADSSIY